MGYAGYLDKRLKAQSLRKRGISYTEILRTVPVSKSTLSKWCRDIALNEEQALRLFRNKLRGAARGRIIGAKRQQVKRIERQRILRAEGVRRVGELGDRDRFIAGVALYAAEGTKGDRYVGFANSDPAAIKFMMRWFRDFFEVPEEKFRGAIWIHEGLDVRRAVRFWSKLTGISIAQFHKTYVVENKKESRKIRKNIHPYGVFSIKVSDKHILRLIIGCIAGLLGEIDIE